MNGTGWTITTLGGIAVAYYALLGRLHYAEMASLDQEIIASYARFERAELESAQAETLQRTVSDLEGWQRELGALLTLDPLSTPPQLAITATLRAAGLSVERAETAPADGKPASPHQRLKVAVAGTFGDLFTAIRNLENEVPPTRVTDLSVQAAADPTRVRCDLTIVRTWSIER